MSRIRVRKQDRQALKALKEREEVRELAIEEGIIEEGESLHYRDVLLLIIPDDAEVISRPEKEMVLVRTYDDKHDEDVAEMVRGLAGENVPAHEVVNRHLTNFAEQYDIDIDNER